MRTRALTVCLLGTCLALISACEGSNDPAPTPQPPPPKPQPFMPGARFVATTAATGIDRVFNTGDSPISKDEQRIAGGVACFDSDRDGDLDLLITNNQGQESVVFYENQLAGDHHYLAIRLTGSGANTRGIGTCIEVRTRESAQVREIRAGNHYVSQNPAEAHFGLGAETTADVNVRWPDGSETNLTSVAVDRLLVIEQQP